MLKSPFSDRPTIHLQPEALMQRARDATGLTDFGDPWFLTPFEGLIGWINTEGGLTNEGVWPIQVLVDHLSNRLRLVQLLKRKPEILDEKIDVAGVIIAHGRGGSTLLQRLLTASPQITACRWWELITPLPLEGEVIGDPSKRIEIAQQWMDQFKIDAPDIKSVHPMNSPMDYDEEIMFINHTFLSTMYCGYFNIPSFNVWQMKQDQRKAYVEIKTWLQVLQFHSPDHRGRKWVLKAPHHLWNGNLHTVIDTFPDAKLLMTHRNLEKVIASLCSSEVMMNIWSEPNNLDSSRLGPPVVEMYAAALQSMMEVRREQPDRFIDVQYNDLLSNPIGEFRRVMEAMNLTVSDDDIRATQAWMDSNPRESFPPHNYTIEDYGLTSEVIAEKFRSYHEQFLVR